MTDAALNPAAVTALYRSHADLVWRRARSILHNEADAHDLVQEIFLSLWRNPGVFRGESKVTTFLYAVTTRAALARLRQGKNQLRLIQQTPETAPVPDARPGPDQTVDVRTLLGRCPEHIAEVAVYYYVDGMSQQEIAGLLEVHRSVVAERLHRFIDITRSTARDVEAT